MIIVKNGTVIDPAAGREGEFDLLIEGDTIAAVDKPGSIKKEGATVIDARGRWVVPGLIDLHVHLREPGFEWKETIATGSQAAVLGGFTTVCCMPNTNPSNDCAEITKFILEKACAAAAARVLPIGAVSVGLKGKQMAPLSELWQAGCAAFSDDGEPIYDAGMMRRALEWCRMHGATISCHEEDKNLSCGGCMNESPLSTRLGLRGMHKVAEDVMVARDIELGRVTQGKVHICHVSSARSVELIRRAKNDGIAITAEVTPHHLVLSESAVTEYDTNAKMSPPLRDEEDMSALLAGIKDGTLDAIASDHAPHELDSKMVEFSRASFGILGLQTSLPLILGFVKKKKLSRLRAIELLTSSPAKAFGLAYGTLKPGAKADIAIINPEERWTFDRDSVKSLSFNSPFLGQEMTGKAETVIVNGAVVVQQGNLVAK